MSQLKIRNALINQLVTGVSYEVALENSQFKPKGDTYLAAFFIPVQEQILAKTAPTPDWSTGFMQVDVYAKTEKGAMDLDNLSVIDEVSALFRNGDTITLDGIGVYIRDKNLIGGGYDGGFYTSSIRVYYSAFASR